LDGDLVALGDLLPDLALAGEGLLHLEAGQEPEVLDHLRVARIAGGDAQGAVPELEGDHRVAAHELEGEGAGRLRGHLQAAQAHALEAELLREGAGEAVLREVSEAEEAAA